MRSPKLTIATTLLLIAIVGFSNLSAARENGFAFECKDIHGSQSKIVSFLETGQDKIANSIENSTIKIWDTHKWSEKTLLIESFIQRPDDEMPVLTDSIAINRETLEAVYASPNLAQKNIRMNCKRWSPRTRNK